MFAPFDAVSRVAVLSVCELAGVRVVPVERADGLVELHLDGAAVAALVEAASGLDGSSGSSGCWADHAGAGLVARLCARDGDVWVQEATMHVAELLASAADHFDAVSLAALDGPVLFDGLDALTVAGAEFPAVAWASWATVR